MVTADSNSIQGTANSAFYHCMLGLAALYCYSTRESATASRMCITTAVLPGSLALSGPGNKVLGVSTSRSLQIQSNRQAHVSKLCMANVYTTCPHFMPQQSPQIPAAAVSRSSGRWMTCYTACVNQVGFGVASHSTAVCSCRVWLTVKLPATDLHCVSDLINQIVKVPDLGRWITSRGRTSK